jgi:hypothetical protein
VIPGLTVLRTFRTPSLTPSCPGVVGFPQKSPRTARTAGGAWPAIEVLTMEQSTERLEIPSPRTATAGAKTRRGRRDPGDGAIFQRADGRAGSRGSGFPVERGHPATSTGRRRRWRGRDWPRRKRAIEDGRTCWDTALSRSHSTSVCASPRRCSDRLLRLSMRAQRPARRGLADLLLEGSNQIPERCCIARCGLRTPEVRKCRDVEIVDIS